MDLNPGPKEGKRGRIRWTMGTYYPYLVSIGLLLNNCLRGIFTIAVVVAVVVVWTDVRTSVKRNLLE